MSTFLPNVDEVERNWWLVDAEGQTLGRLAARVAEVLRGKNKSIFTPFMDCGDFVIVVNAEKVKVSGKKETQKVYRRHSGYPHGFKEETLGHLRARKPEKIVERAIKGMLPHSRLGARQFTKLKVYAGNEHPHQAQNPQKLELSI